MNDMPQRERLETDVVIVGAGPSGLCAAIRLKQIALAEGRDIGVTIVEKSAAVGGHIISGAVMMPEVLDRLLPDWRARSGISLQAVTSEHMHYLTAKGGLEMPHLLMPPQLKMSDGLIVSLGDVCQWLAGEAEALGVEIYPSTAAVELLINAGGRVEGIVTGDLGRARDGSEKEGFAQGIELAAQYTLLAEGARGSLAKSAISRFGLADGASPQLYGLGIKEVWEIDAAAHQPGRVDHYLGWPLDDQTSGGGFLYHASQQRVFVGLITHLNYSNPTLSPFDAFQSFKEHPEVAAVLSGAKRIGYGARAITSGGLQSIPDLAFPGGALIGCAAGFMNVPRIKGIHTAMASGVATAEAVADAIAAQGDEKWIGGLNDRVLASGIGRELGAVRNSKPLWTRFGTLLGGLMIGSELWFRALFRFSPLPTLRHRKFDFERLRPINEAVKISYRPADGKLRFDRSSSVYLANLAHDDDQPVHLVLADETIPIHHNLPLYGEPAPLYCPAGVYELVDEAGVLKFRINAGNCVHCKTCDIKDPAQNINWVPPEGGSGPNYSGM